MNITTGIVNTGGGGFGGYTRYVGVLPSDYASHTSTELVHTGANYSLTPCITTCNAMPTCSGFAVTGGQGSGQGNSSSSSSSAGWDWRRPVTCDLYTTVVARLVDARCDSGKQFTAFFQKPNGAPPTPPPPPPADVPYQQFAGLLPLYRTSVLQTVTCNGNVSVCRAACDGDRACVGYALIGCQPEAPGTVCWTYAAAAASSLTQDLIDNACYYQKPGVPDVPVIPEPAPIPPDQPTCGPPPPPGCTYGCKFGASEWSDGTPAFNCKIRKLAWDYGRQLHPQYNQFEDLYYALGLNVRAAAAAAASAGSSLVISSLLDSHFSVMNFFLSFFSFLLSPFNHRHALLLLLLPHPPPQTKG